jgi:hypothetical protein
MNPAAPRGALRRLIAFADRERRIVLEELVKIRGLMPLLMKRRNRGGWSKEELDELRMQLRRLRALSPYIAVLVLPGGLALLPLMAWWLDRRRLRRAQLDQAAGKADAPP